MASVSASPSADHKKEKLSFAKIAAAGIKPPNAQHNPNTNSTSNHKQDMPSSPRDGDAVVTPSNGIALPGVAPKHKKLVQLQTKETQETVDSGTSAPELRVQGVDSSPNRSGVPALEVLLMPSSSDDTATQVSSSNDSNKPASVDGKSVASGTTFALDEKDSLRPDDSASVKAAEDEDMYSAPGSGLPSRIGSDDGVRAFRDQLREISSMEPSRGGVPPQSYNSAPKGVLYVPSQGPGVGPVPSPARGGPPPDTNVDFPPDQKLLDALDNPRDRVWVLKLEQDVIDFVKDNQESSLILPQCHSFYRLLAHKMADYYMLGHLVDDTSAAVRLYKMPNCRIPPPLTGITAPSTAASTPPPTAPAMKILRRGVDGPAIANGSNLPSKSASETGDSGDEKKKAPATREEREARYEAARLRIMGSAKPSESPETPRETQDSRSSSATGKKSKKKAREDNDDGFEARSAYSNYYNTSMGSDHAASASYGYTGVAESAANHYANVYSQPTQSGSFQQVPMQMPSSSAWNQQPYHSSDPTQAWAQGQSGAYDLSADFQRSMSFQNQVTSQTPSAGYTQNYGQSYGQSYYTPQQGWQQQQQYPPQSQGSQSGYGYQPSYTPPSTQSRDMMPYAFGQLPSQAFPGRPASKTEHPLPGSYKGKHFNPQSQAFVPGQASNSPLTPQAVPSIPSGFGQPFAAPPSAQLSRHSSAQSQSSSFGSPHQSQQHPTQHLTSSQPLTHPLPQGPVFPRKPSPNVPLPPKPGTASQNIAHFPAQPAGGMPQPPLTQSIISKWGAPSSLPAKPPPPNKPFDGGKSTQFQAQPYNAANAAAAARMPGAGYSQFSAMPQAHIVNGSGGKR